MRLAPQLRYVQPAIEGEPELAGVACYGFRACIGQSYEMRRGRCPTLSCGPRRPLLHYRSRSFYGGYLRQSIVLFASILSHVEHTTGRE